MLAAPARRPRPRAGSNAPLPGRLARLPREPDGCLNLSRPGRGTRASVQPCRSCRPGNGWALIQAGYEGLPRVSGAWEDLQDARPPRPNGASPRERVKLETAKPYDPRRQGRAAARQRPGRSAEKFPQFLLIDLGGPLRLRQFRRHGTDTRRGNRYLGNQGLARHSVIALPIIVRDMSLIAPEQVHAVPRGLRSIPLLRPESVHPRRLTASR
jgi:hypothetical protein